MEIFGGGEGGGGASVIDKQRNRGQSRLMVARWLRASRCTSDPTEIDAGGTLLLLSG